MVRHKVFIVWFIIFLAWSFYRANFFYPEWVDEFLVKPLIFVLPVLYVVLIREKQGLAELGLSPTLKQFFTDIYIGVVIGVLFALEGLAANYLKYGQFSFVPIFAVKVSGGIIAFLLTNLATACWEEILGRGYLFNKLHKITGNVMGSAFTSSFLFLLLHIPILFTRLRLMGPSLIIYPISILLLGVTNSYIFSFRKNLTLPILIHTFWNMTVALYL